MYDLDKLANDIEEVGKAAKQQIGKLKTDALNAPNSEALLESLRETEKAIATSDMPRLIKTLNNLYDPGNK